MNNSEILNTWLQNLYSELKELSDLDYQEKLWFDKIPGRISNFIELYCRFDDYNLDLFIDDQMPKLSLSTDFIREFDILRNMMNKYDDHEQNDRQILDDPEWHKIADQAKIVLDYWEKELGIPEQMKD